MPRKPKVRLENISSTNIPIINGNNSNIPELNLSKSTFRFVTAYPWLGFTDNFIKKHEFTNLLTDGEEFATKITELIEEIILKINSDNEQLFKYDTDHCHSLKGEKLKIAQSIAKDLVDNDFKEITDETDYVWWQIGFKGSTRLVGILSRSDNCFYPIFVDWHHLLFPDVKHNQNDLKKYKYDPHK